LGPSGQAPGDPGQSAVKGSEMKLAIASGKGGTGKTTVATCLATLLADAGERVTYVDCDAEEPNGHLILRPTIARTTDVHVTVVDIDAVKCTNCGECCRACQFNALACLRDSVSTFPQLCHGCGVCSLVCPSDAIIEVQRKRGVIRDGHAGEIHFIGGQMIVGEESVTPVIRAVKAALPGDGIAILDAPPGTACPAVETMRGADRAILVTEPTPFGLSDLMLAAGAAKELNVEVGVVINRCDVGTSDTLEYCAEEGLPVLLEVPNDRAVAVAYSRGILPTEAVPGFREAMLPLVDEVVAWKLGSEGA
jgi:MinD superfamily P-loop ATPase